MCLCVCVGCIFLPLISNKAVVCEPVEDADDTRTNFPRTLQVLPALLKAMMILEFAISRPQLVASCYYNTSISQSASKKEILSRLLDLILKTFQLYKNLSSFPELF